MGHLSGERLYEIFARRKREDRFEHVGTIQAPGPELARVYAWQTYDEAKWFEMIVAPRGAFHAVNREEVPFTLHSAEVA
jgi:1,2-phenylacetyl-CoA epoxidase PaaB subunit